MTRESEERPDESRFISIPGEFVLVTTESEYLHAEGQFVTPSVSETKILATYSLFEDSTWYSRHVGGSYADAERKQTSTINQIVCADLILHGESSGITRMAHA